MLDVARAGPVARPADGPGPGQWQVPECVGGTIDTVITFAFAGEGEARTVSGTWVESAPQVLFTGSDGRDCGVYLSELQIASA